MFSLSARFRKSRRPSVEGTVYYVIRHGKTERDETGNIHGVDESVISVAKDRIAFDLMTIYCIIENMLESGNDVTLDGIAEAAASAILTDNPFEKRIKKYQGKYPVSRDVARVAMIFSDKFEYVRKASARSVPEKSGLLSFFSFLIDEYTAEGKRSVKSLRSTQLSLQKFLHGTDMPLSSLTASFISEYKASIEKGVSASTLSFYMRVLRTVLKRAEQEKLLPEDFYWPSDIKTSILRSKQKTDSLSLDIQAIRSIERLDLSRDLTLDLVRDMFMFGFYAQGLEFIEIINLKPEDINGNRLTFRRRLVGTTHSVMLGEKALAIVRKYHDRNPNYIFPIVDNGKWIYSYGSIKAKVARALEKIGKLLKPPLRLTFSMNIYSWKSIINHTNIADLLISS